jgi:hypothetical protein
VFPAMRRRLARTPLLLRVARPSCETGQQGCDCHGARVRRPRPTSAKTNDGQGRRGHRTRRLPERERLAFRGSLLTAAATAVHRWVKVAQPSPYAPGSDVSTRTTTRLMPGPVAWGKRLTAPTNGPFVATVPVRAYPHATGPLHTSPCSG